MVEGWPRGVPHGWTVARRRRVRALQARANRVRNQRSRSPANVPRRSRRAPRRRVAARHELPGRGAREGDPRRGAGRGAGGADPQPADPQGRAPRRRRLRDPSTPDAAVGRRRAHALPPRTPDLRPGADPRGGGARGFVRGARRRCAPRGRRRGRHPGRRAAHGASARRRRRADGRPEVPRSARARPAPGGRPRRASRRDPPVAPAGRAPRERPGRARGGRGFVGRRAGRSRPLQPGDPRGLREAGGRGPVPGGRGSAPRRSERRADPSGPAEHAARGRPVTRARLARCVRRRLPARRRLGRARGQRHRLGGAVATDPSRPRAGRRVASGLADLRRSRRGDGTPARVRVAGGAAGGGGRLARAADRGGSGDRLDWDRTPEAAGRADPALVPAAGRRGATVGGRGRVEGGTRRGRVRRGASRGRREARALRWRPCDGAYRCGRGHASRSRLRPDREGRAVRSVQSARARGQPAARRVVHDIGGDRRRGPGG